MELSNKTYNRLKWFITIFLPAFMGLVAGFGALGFIPNAEVIVAAIGLIGTFLGSIISVSTKNYNNREEGNNG